MLNKYKSVIALKGEKLGRTNLLKSEINTGDNPPVYTKQYPLPHKLKMEASKLFEVMLNEGVIRHSKSPWSSPLTLVSNKDKSLRSCVEFGVLNEV